MKHPTLEKLHELKLTGMMQALQEQSNDDATYGHLGFEERLGLLLDREADAQGNRRLTSRLKRANLRQQACIENIDYRARRNLDKAQMLSLAQCGWVKARHNILITGPCGVGKSFLACALAHKACLMGYSAQYIRAQRLFEDLAVARGDGRYLRILGGLARVNVLIIDDWGLTVLTEAERRDLLEIMEDRHQRQCTIVTSQLPVPHWHEAIGNATLADAILDRLVHNAYRIELKGESLRKKHAAIEVAANG